MFVLLSDLESVLAPEIWQIIAKKLKIPELEITTRQIPNFKKLMNYRIKILRHYDITFTEIASIVSKIKPFPYAKRFIKNIQKFCSFVIITDSFYELCSPLISKLDYPLTFANTLVIKNDYIVGYKIRIGGRKEKIAEIFKNFGYKTIALGDSFNDLSLLKTCDYAIFYKPECRKIKSKIFTANSLKEVEKIVEEIVK